MFSSIPFQRGYSTNKNKLSLKYRVLLNMEKHKFMTSLKKKKSNKRYLPHESYL